MLASRASICNGLDSWRKARRKSYESINCIFKMTTAEIFRRRRLVTGFAWLLQDWHTQTRSSIHSYTSFLQNLDTTWCKWYCAFFSIADTYLWSLVYSGFLTRIVRLCGCKAQNTNDKLQSQEHEKESEGKKTKKSRVLLPTNIASETDYRKTQTNF